MATNLPEQRRDERLARAGQAISSIVEQASQVNIAPGERWFSVLSGAALAFYGLRRLDWPGILLAMLGGDLLFRGISGHSFLYQALERDSTEKPVTLPTPGGQEACIQRSLTVQSSPAELYTFWRRLENAPRFMPDVVSVKETGVKTSHWVARGPEGKTYTWDAELTTDEPGRCIAWRVYGKAPLVGSGSVRFTPARGKRGTIVTLGLDNVSTRGPLGKITGPVSDFRILETLRRFKEAVEAGEAPTVTGQPDGRE